MLTAFVAWRSETPFFETLVNLPSTVVDYMFDPIGELPFIFTIALQLVLTVGVFGALFWFMGKGGVETYFPDDVSVRFEDVWGQDAVLEKMKENLVFVEDPESIEQRGGHVPGGVLLYGPPGTGKTLMAEAVAGETGKPYVFVEPGAFLNMFFGVGVLKVRSLFKKLRKLALRYGGVIVFFDEADALGNRGVPSGGTASPSTPISPHLCNGINYMSDATKSSLLFDQRAEDADTGRGGIFRLFMPGMRGGGGGDISALQALLARDVRPHQAARVHEPLRAPAPRHAAEASAQVPHLLHHGVEHARLARRRAAAPRPPRPQVQGRLSVEGRSQAHVRGLSQPGEAPAHRRRPRTARRSSRRTRPAHRSRTR